MLQGDWSADVCSSDLSQAQKKDDPAKDDQKFWHDFAQANMAEVEAGKLAQQKAKSEEVKKFGEHMIQEIGRAACREGEERTEDSSDTRKADATDSERV